LPLSNEPRRGVTVGARGMVSAGHSLAAATALHVLQSGANAVDAGLAASAVQCVVEMPWCGLGGDTFWLIHTPADGVVAFNGSGVAPRGLHPGLIPTGRQVPRVGPLSVAVPGLVSTWEAIASRFASRPLADLLAPAIAYARDGFPVYPRLAHAIAKLTGRSSTLGTVIEDNGRLTGELFRQPALAETLEAIAADGARAFYGGRIGASIVQHVHEGGGVLSLDDLAGQHVSAVAPIRVPYRGREVLTQPPVSLGCVLLQQLRILDGIALDGLQSGSPELIDLLVQCKQAAFTDAATLGDPDEQDNRLEWLLSEERAGWWRANIARHTRTPAHTPALAGAGSDTTSTVIADGQGGVVCLIQSLFNEWGARELVADCGVLLNDRLANLAVDEHVPNGLRGGRRPLHTLNTYIVLEAGVPVLAGATPGGRGQVQTNLQVLVNVLDFGMDVQTAVDEPRWISGLPYRGENDQTLYLEPTFPPETAEALREMGHTVALGVELGDRADPFGNCTVIARAPLNGTFQGAADMRRDAFAIGW
jgi:gamma-glutamyltranspeptidase / glutathione hydrolase